MSSLPSPGPGAEGTLMTFSPDPRTNAANKEIVELFRKKGFEPQAYTLYSYAGVQIIKQAAEQAKSLDPKKVAEVMHSGKIIQHRARRNVLRQEGRRDRLHCRRQEKGPLRSLRLEERPRRQDHLCRDRVIVRYRSTDRLLDDSADAALQCVVAQIEKHILRGYSPCSAMILPLGHGLMAQPWGA